VGNSSVNIASVFPHSIEDSATFLSSFLAGSPNKTKPQEAFSPVLSLYLYMPTLLCKVYRRTYGEAIQERQPRSTDLVL